MLDTHRETERHSEYSIRRFDYKKEQPQQQQQKISYLIRVLTKHFFSRNLCLLPLRSFFSLNTQQSKKNATCRYVYISGSNICLITRPSVPFARKLKYKNNINWYLNQIQWVVLPATIFFPEQLEDTQKTKQQANKQTNKLPNQFRAFNSTFSLYVYIRDIVSSILYVVGFFFDITVAIVIIVVAIESWSTKYFDAIFTSHFHVFIE